MFNLLFQYFFEILGWLAFAMVLSECYWVFVHKVKILPELKIRNEKLKIEQEAGKKD